MILFLFLCYLGLASGFYNKTMDCNEKIVFVLDSSSSVNNFELYGKIFTFKRYKNEINYIIDSNKHIKPNNIALVQMGNTPSLVIDFNGSNKNRGLNDTAASSPL